jgi:sialate O-acetylesterase
MHTTHYPRNRYQGEADTTHPDYTTWTDPSYACLFPAMITGWREAFQVPDAYFGFVQLSTWCTGLWNNIVMNGWIAAMRETQMAALSLSKVG